MLFTLSEKRNETLLLEWSGEITDRHAQDFCDVCNAVFYDHFDLDYMRRKYYEPNIYGKSFIVVIYKDNKPIAAQGAWRNDLDGKIAFQLCDFVTLPEARKGGYILDLSHYITEEIRKYFPEAIIYGYPGEMAYRICIASGSIVTEHYAHIFTGTNSHFLENIPVIDDMYAETFMLKRKNVFMHEINGQCYLLDAVRIKRIIPAKIFLGKVSAETGRKFRRCSTFGLCIYHSPDKGKVFGNKRMYRSNITYPDSHAHEEGYVLPLYKADGYSIDFNGRNKH